MVTEFKRAAETNIYLEMLVFRIKDISDLYSALLTNYAKIATNEDIYNAFLSEMIVVTSHLLAKLEGGGERTRTLLNEFDEFKPWLDDISLPKINLEESKKIHKLFRLILRAYDALGLSNI